MLLQCSQMLNSGHGLRHQVSHPYKTASKIIILCNLTLTSLDNKEMVKGSAMKSSRHSTYLLILWCLQLLLVLFPSIWTLAHFKGFISCLYVPLLLKLMKAYSIAAYEHKDHHCLNVPYHTFPTTFTITHSIHTWFLDMDDFCLHITVFRKCHARPWGLVNKYLQNISTCLPKHKASQWP